MIKHNYRSETGVSYDIEIDELGVVITEKTIFGRTETYNIKDIDDLRDDGLKKNISAWIKENSTKTKYKLAKILGEI